MAKYKPDQVVAVSLVRPDDDNHKALIVYAVYDGSQFHVWSYAMGDRATDALSLLEDGGDLFGRDLRDLFPGKQSHRATVISEKAAIKLGYRTVGELMENPGRVGWREVYFGANSFAVKSGKVAAPDPTDNPEIGNVPETAKAKIFSGSDDDFAKRRRRRRRRRTLANEVKDAEDNDAIVNVYHPASGSEIEHGTRVVGRGFTDEAPMTIASQALREHHERRGGKWDFSATLIRSGTSRTVIAVDDPVGYKLHMASGGWVGWAFIDEGGMYCVGNSSWKLDGREPEPAKPRPIHDPHGYQPYPGSATIKRIVRKQTKRPPKISGRAGRASDVPAFDPECEVMVWQPTSTKHGGKWYCVRLVSILDREGSHKCYEVSISHGRFGSPNFRHKNPDVFADFMAARNAFYNRLNAKLNKGYQFVDAGSTILWFNRDSK